MNILLSGPMGAGKTTVGRVVAEQLGRAFVDLDAEIERRAGRTVAELFAADGEPAFRALEETVLRETCAAAVDAVIALGGGTVTHPVLRRWLLRSAVLVTLRASVAVLAERVGAGAGRPLLGVGQPREILSRLLATRAAAYAECHASLDTTDRTPEQIAADVARVAEKPPILVAHGLRSYRVHVGAGILSNLADGMAEREPLASLVVIVTDRNVQGLWASRARAALSALGLPIETCVLSSGEEHKTIASVEEIWNAALRARVDRNALVVAVGGGVVGDLAGFAASTLLRGLRVGHVPTTVLSMADSAVGGKTGFDRPEGKNLVGTFHAPVFVLCDVETLSTLPERERIAGLAEVVKSAWLDGEVSVAALERDAEALRRGDAGAMTRAIRMAASLKARVVAEDEREGGIRTLLNLGHTVGHAIEAGSGYQLLHGEAVALGLVAAFRVGEHVAPGEGGDRARAQGLLARLGLPTDLSGWSAERVRPFLEVDKKRAGGRVRFVLPGAPGNSQVIPLSLDEVGHAAFGLGGSGGRAGI